MLAIAKSQKNRKVYECKCCDYTTCNSFDFDKHNTTAKHKNNSLAIKTGDLAINISQKSLHCIQKLFKSDIRSMINFLQSNQDIVKTHAGEQSHLNIIDNDVWDILIGMLIKKEKINKIKSFIDGVSIEYNIDKKNIVKDFLNYIIRNYPKYISKEFLNFTENLMHSEIQNNNIHIYYSLSKISTLLSA